MMNCGDFQLLTERIFGAFFNKHGFKRLGTPIYQGEDRKAGGPLCVWFYESSECRLKFYHGDGEVNMLVGLRSAPVNGIGQRDGWRYIRSFFPPHPWKWETKSDEQMLGELLSLLEPNYSLVLQGSAE